MTEKSENTWKKYVKKYEDIVSSVFVMEEDEDEIAGGIFSEEELLA